MHNMRISFYNHFSVNFTEPISAIFPISFLPRSINIKCSASSFSSDSKSFSSFWSSSCYSSSLVPAIGLTVTFPDFSLTSISGEEAIIKVLPKLKKLI